MGNRVVFFGAAPCQSKEEVRAHRNAEPGERPAIGLVRRKARNGLQKFGKSASLLERRLHPFLHIVEDGARGAIGIGAIADE